MTFGPEGDESSDRGVWMSIFVDDVDKSYRHCLAQGIEITWPPTDMPWGVREMHVRHPMVTSFESARVLVTRMTLQIRKAWRHQWAKTEFANR